MNFRYLKQTVGLSVYRQIYEGTLIKFIKDNLKYSPILILSDDFMIPMNIVGYAYCNLDGIIANHWDSISFLIKDKQDRQKLLDFLKPHLKKEG